MTRLSDLLRAALAAYVAPLRAAAADVVELPVDSEDPDGPTYVHPRGLLALLRDAGLEAYIDGDLIDALPDVAQGIATAGATFDAMAASRDEIDQITRLIDAAFAVVDALAPLQAQLDRVRTELAALDPELAAEVAADIGRSIASWLIYHAIERTTPITASALRMIGALVPPQGEGDPTLVQIGKLKDAFEDPQAALEAAIGWGTPDVDAAAIYDLAISIALRLGLRHWMGLRSDEPALFVALLPEAPINGGLWLQVQGPNVPNGIALGFWGEGALEETFTFGEAWSGDAKAETELQDLPVFGLDDAGARVAAGNPNVKATAGLTLRYAPDDRIPLIPLGGLGGIDAGAVTFGLNVDEAAQPAVTATIEDGVVALTPQGADGFLSRILRGEGVAAPFNIAAAWRDGRIDVDGSISLDLDIPVGRSLSGPISVDTLHFSLPLLPVGASELKVAATGSAKLGPFAVSVSRIGAAVELALDPDGGPAGARAVRSGIEARVGDLALAFAFAPPKGLGLTLDLGPVGGGGFLEIDVEAGRYAGALALKAEAVGLHAFGVILTKMPDGSDGFSMLAFVRGEFTPIPLGFGFTLNAVGGLLGINRDLDSDALFAAVRAGRAGDLLAPDDPIADAPTLIALAEAIFPPRQGRHVFGPTLQLGWGAPKSLITLDLALALTLPAPLRILLIGRLRAVLPNEVVPVVQLNLDVAGILDLGRGTLDVEGRLFDSVIQTIPISGGFALKTGWKETQVFAFSVGGLHPGFAPPAGFPVLPRAGVDLSKTPGLTLRLEAYFAVTSNSLQLGAAVHLRAKAGKFGLEGHLGFDALIIFYPFEIDAELRASVRIFRESRTLMRLGLRARLRGPDPWRIEGEVTFEILWVDVSIRVSKTIGAAVPRNSAQVMVLPIFKAALDAAANWSSNGADPLILTGEADRAVPGLDLVFSQKDIPIAMDLELFGGLEIGDVSRFEIVNVNMGGRTVTLSRTPPREAFAVGSFLALSDADKLVAPDFQDLASGIRIDGSSAARSGSPETVPAGRRILRLDARPDRVPPLPDASDQPDWAPPEVTLSRARAERRAAVWIDPERWAAGPLHDRTGPFDSWAEARAASPDGTVTRWIE